MSTLDQWRRMEGTALDGRAKLIRILAVEPHPLFEAELTQSGERCAAWFLPEASVHGSPLERYLEAIYLDHRNLLQCHGAGRLQLDGEHFVYALLDRWDTTLEEVVERGPLPPEEARVLGLEAIEALRYLHGRDLVYCNLRPDTVVRKDGVWKLSDYSQLRVPDSGYAAETRRLLAAGPGTPPEAFQGIVSPGWDAWSLAALLSAAVSPPRVLGPDGLGEPPRAARELPEPFATIATESFVWVREERCGLERIEELLRAGGEAKAAPEPLPRAAPVPFTRPRSDEANERNSPRNAFFGVLAAAALALALYFGMAGKPRATVTPSAAAPAVVQERKPDPGQPPQEASRMAAPETEDKPNPVPEENSSPKPAGEEAAIHSLLDSWSAAIRRRNAEVQAGFYAPTVDVFYQARNVSRDWIRRNRADALQRAGDIRRFDIAGVQTNFPSPNRAVVTFDKTWDFAGRRRDRGKVRTELVLLKTGGRWQISSERDIRVIRNAG